MRKVLITGAFGLVGSELMTLLRRDPETQIYAVVTPNEVSYTLAPQKNVKILFCDFTKSFDFSGFPTQVDVVIHLAMSPDSKNFPEKGVEIFNVNTLSTLHLLNFARNAHVKKFIFTSSGVYNYSSAIIHAESEDININNIPDFYLSTKVCSEILLMNYQDFFDICTLRLFFVYGNNQRKEMLIPRLIENIKIGIPIHIDKNGGIKLNPTHVSDVARTIYESINLQGSHTINIAGNEVVTMRQLADIIGDILSTKPIYEFRNIGQSMVADNSKMKSLLSAPLVNLKNGISKLIENVGG